MFVYVVCFQYLQGYKLTQSYDIEEINKTPILEIYSDKSKALISSINFNLKYLYGLDINNINMIEFADIPDGYPIEKLEKKHTDLLTMIKNDYNKNGNRYFSKHTIIMEYLIG